MSRSVLQTLTAGAICKPSKPPRVHTAVPRQWSCQSLRLQHLHRSRSAGRRCSAAVQIGPMGPLPHAGRDSWLRTSEASVDWFYELTSSSPRKHGAGPWLEFWYRRSICIEYLALDTLAKQALNQKRRLHAQFYKIQTRIGQSAYCNRN